MIFAPLISLAAIALAAVPPPSRDACAPASLPERHVVMAGGQPITVWSRRAEHPAATIVLVHGRTWSSLPDFDLQVQGESRSVMAALVARGFAVYAVDLRGYGATPRDASGWDTPQRAVDDVAAVLTWLHAAAPAAARPVLLGWSNGSMVSQLLAQERPQLISKLILYGYPYSGTPFPPDSAGITPARTATDDASARSDFIEPSVTSAKMVDCYATTALRRDPVRTDWRRLDQWNALNPARVRVPLLLLQGEFDPSVTRDVLQKFFDHLGTRTKTWITLKGGDHAALLEDTTPLFVDAVARFATP